MTIRAPYKIHSHVLAADRSALTAVAGLGDYAPFNPQWSIDAARQLEAALLEAQLVESRLMRELDVVHEQVAARAWAFHEAIKGMKAQVVAQYGSDSPALHAIGFKRKSEHNRGKRRKVSAGQA